jgi:hypothetical protein
VWIYLQTEFRRVADRDLPLRLGTVVKIVKSCVITAVFTTLLLLLQRGFTWWQAIVFSYCNLVNNLMTDFWVLTSNALILTAEGIEISLTQVRVDQREAEGYSVTQP